MQFFSMIHIKLILFVLLLSFGQLFFKKSAVEKSLLEIGFFQVNYWLFFAVFLYVCATGIWINVLKTTPLSFAYLYTALGFVFIPIASHYLFSEKLTVQYWFGTAFIIVGLLIVSFAKN